MVPARSSKNSFGACVLVYTDESSPLLYSSKPVFGWLAIIGDYDVNDYIYEITQDLSSLDGGTLDVVDLSRGDTEDFSVLIYMLLQFCFLEHPGTIIIFSQSPRMFGLFSTSVSVHMYIRMLCA